MDGLQAAGCTLLQLDVTDPASVDRARDEVLGQIGEDDELVRWTTLDLAHSSRL